MPSGKLEPLSDLCTPWCIRVAATLHIANHISAGTNQINALAEAAGCNPGALHHVLGHLVSKGIFEETAAGQFALNEIAQELLDPSVQISLDMDGLGSRVAGAWSTLLSYVRTGNPAYQELFGLPFWEDLEAHPQIRESFDALMGTAGHGIPDPKFEISGGWDLVRTVVDVGGGTGSMLAEILRLRPWIHGILVDLPKTVARSKDVFSAAGVVERVTLMGQSFFDPLPGGADLYLLRGILNDWPDQEAETILRRCSEAAFPAGRIVVLKSVGGDDVTKDIYIETLLLGGWHRTITEFTDLARRSGLDVSTVGQNLSGDYIVECRPINRCS
jgi:hypothetical protein